MILPPGWIVPDWPAPPHVSAFVTARAGGVSRGSFDSFNLGDRTDDDPAAVAENKRRLRTLLPDEPRWLHQVHGATAVRADDIAGAVDADASYTCTPGVVCAVKVADCMPVLLCDRAGTVIAAAHAGWRGLSQGIVENTIGELGCDPAALMAFLGPAIGPQAFEVGDDVMEAFVRPDPAARSAFVPLRAGKWLADLFALARRRLARAGVHEVHGGGLCTFADGTRFFSHRRDHTTGRMAACIWIGHDTVAASQALGVDPRPPV